MRIGNGKTFVEINHRIFADGHGIGLDVIGNAFGGARLKIEPHRISNGEHEAQKNGNQETPFQHFD